MSGWGSTEIGGEAVDAWGFRSRYLAYGEKHEVFYCPFCDVQLAGYLIYTDGELSKSPHFSARWDKHAYGCNGEPVEVDEPERKPPKAHYTPRSMQVPEALTDRPPPREIRPKGIGKPVEPPTELLVATRRQHASSLGRPVPKTHLLQPIVEARNITLQEIYEVAKEKKWDTEKRNVVIQEAFAVLPLRLEDQTNYGDAFRGPSAVNPKYPRIYHGQGDVVEDSGDFVITSAVNGKIKGESKTFRVKIAPTIETRYHRALVAQLQTFAAEKKQFRWYAYGKPSIKESAIVVLVENLDYLYLKTIYQKQP